MLIKYYNLDDDIYIIEGVQDVTIPSKESADRQATQDVEGFNEFNFDKVVSALAPLRFIEYAKDGPCRLFVYGTAYICSDDGKTIHKLEVNGKVV
jgi:hypothetical protein